MNGNKNDRKRTRHKMDDKFDHMEGKVHKVNLKDENNIKVNSNTEGMGVSDSEKQKAQNNRSKKVGKTFNPNFKRSSIACNWNTFLKNNQSNNINSKTISSQNPRNIPPSRNPKTISPSQNSKNIPPPQNSKDIPPARNSEIVFTKVLALDCEMVGCGNQNALARVSIVNRFGDCVYDKYVKPEHEITDYRTKVSGITKENLENAELFSKVAMEVKKIIANKILVGHSIQNDLAVLDVHHPKKYIRDTAKFFRRKGLTPSLKSLVWNHFKIVIQEGEHCSIEDARSALNLYNLYKSKWDAGSNSAPNCKIDDLMSEVEQNRNSKKKPSTLREDFWTYYLPIMLKYKFYIIVFLTSLTTFLFLDRLSAMKKYSNS